MTSLKPPLAQVEWGFGLRWVIATTVGWVVGFTLCEALKAFLAAIAYWVGHIGTPDGAVIGISVGIAQGIALRQYISGARWWILASIIGFAIGKVGGDALARAVPGVVGSGLSGAAIGVSVGLVQWFVLRRHIVYAGWWVLASGLAWAVGWSIISVVEETASGPTVTAYIFGVLGAAIAGVITA